MLKKTLLIASLFLFTVKGFSQPKIDRYCEVFMTPKGLSQGVNVFISLGKERDLLPFKDKHIKEDLQKVTKYTTVVDALNYMSSLGWALVNSNTVQVGGNTDKVYFYFKKEFDKSEIDTE